MKERLFPELKVWHLTWLHRPVSWEEVQKSILRKPRAVECAGERGSTNPLMFYQSFPVQLCNCGPAVGTAELFSHDPAKSWVGGVALSITDASRHQWYSYTIKLIVISYSNLFPEFYNILHTFISHIFVPHLLLRNMSGTAHKWRTAVVFFDSP